MSITHKDIDLLTQKASVAGTEKIPVSATEYITPAQIAGTVSVTGVVKYDASQSLTDTQKTQARTNIGAGTSSFSGSYNDLTNQPTIPAAQVQTDWNATTGMGVLLNKPTIPTVPTISTDISADAASDAKTASPKAVKTYVDDAVTIKVATTQPAGGMLPNVMYSLGTISSATTFSLASVSDATIVNLWHFVFTIGSTAPTIQWPTGITISWQTGSAPTINSNCTYEVSILYANTSGYLGMCVEYANS